MTRTRIAIGKAWRWSALLLAAGAAALLLDYLSWYRYFLWAAVSAVAPLVVVVATAWTEEDL